MDLIRLLLRLRNELACIVSHPTGNRDAKRLHSLTPADTIRCALSEAYPFALADTNTVLAGWSLRHWAGSVDQPMGVLVPGTPQRPQSPTLTHYGANSCSFAQLLLWGGDWPLREPAVSFWARFFGAAGCRSIKSR